MWELPENVLFQKAFFFPILVLLMSMELMLWCRKMCCNKTRKIPLNISRMYQTKAETVHHVCLFCCLLDHLKHVNIWTLGSLDLMLDGLFWGGEGVRGGQQFCSEKQKQNVFFIYLEFSPCSPAWGMCQRAGVWHKSPVLGIWGTNKKGLAQCSFAEHTWWARMHKIQ